MYFIIEPMYSKGSIKLNIWPQSFGCNWKEQKQAVNNPVPADEEKAFFKIHANKSAQQ